MSFPIEIRIVIPCYNEPDVLNTIRSLFNCQRGNFGVEIIVVVNSYLISPEVVRILNLQTHKQLSDFAAIHNTSDFYLSTIYVENIPGHQTGAGLPRKIGMDEAVKHFQKEDNLNGIILSLDADCTVKENYLTEVFYHFKKYKLKSATIEFHHPVEHLENEIHKATEAYEEYLRYYRAALEYIGYPYSYYTIGSAFAVTVNAYLQVGGMGKQQAGEDFYFLQKIFPLGKTRFIDTTCVYPAARTSDRVPFGTGPAIAKMLEEKQLKRYSYSVAAWKDLRFFFQKLDLFFDFSPQEIEEELKSLPSYMQSFLKEDEFLEKITEIKKHTANKANFKKRFFQYFTAFKILKYLNYVHPLHFELAEVHEQYSILSKKLSR